MSKASTADLVRLYYQQFNAKNWAGMLDCVGDDIRHDVNEGSRRGGKAKFADFIAHMDRCYDENLTELVIMTNDDGSRAAAEFIVNGVYKATDGDLPPAKGQTYRLPAGAFLEIIDDRIVRVTTRYNLQDWIAQVSG